MGEIALAGRASSTADLAALALDLRGWSMNAAEQLAVDPAAAIARLEARFTPARQEEPTPGSKTNRLVKALGEIGVKVAPAMAQDRAEVWSAVMVKALADLPFAFSIRGAEDALNVPIQFMNEIETVVRAKAAEAESRHKVALHRLRVFQREIAKQPPALPPAEAKDITQDEINAMSLPLRNIGLAKGWITQEQFDAARKDETDADA